jgi:hypothetical protein
VPEAIWHTFGESWEGYVTKFAGTVLLLIGMSGFAVAGGIPTVPEIDPAMGIGALTLLSGGLLILRARGKK